MARTKQIFVILSACAVCWWPLLASGQDSESDLQQFRPRSAFDVGQQVQPPKPPVLIVDHSVRRPADTTFDPKRAAQVLREAAEIVQQIKSHPDSKFQPKYDRERAAESLRAVTQLVETMKAFTPAVLDESESSLDDVKVHHYHKPPRIPGPEQQVGDSGMTRQQLAEMKLQAKGFIRTSNGWRPPNSQTAAKPTTRQRAASQSGSTADEDLFR